MSRGGIGESRGEREISSSSSSNISSSNSHSHAHTHTGTPAHQQQHQPHNSIDCPQPVWEINRILLTTGRGRNCRYHVEWATGEYSSIRPSDLEPSPHVDMVAEYKVWVKRELRRIARTARPTRPLQPPKVVTRRDIRYVLHRRHNFRGGM